MRLAHLNGISAQVAAGHDGYPPKLRSVTSLFQIARDLRRTNAFFVSKQTRLTDELHAGELVQAMQNLFHP